MPGLPIDLSNRCRDALLQCSEFDSHAALQAVFVTDELYPFRSVPEAADKGERVAKCLDYLLEQRATYGRPVLATFLGALRDKYMPGNALRDDLGALAEEVEAALRPTLYGGTLQERYPALSGPIRNEVAVVVDGVVYRNDWSREIPEGAEVFLMRRLAGG